MTALAAMTKRPDRFVGMHFMNPVPVMQLVEVIRALQTSDEAFNLTMELAKNWERRPSPSTTHQALFRTASSCRSSTKPPIA